MLIPETKEKTDKYYLQMFNLNDELVILEPASKVKGEMPEFSFSEVGESNLSNC